MATELFILCQARMFDGSHDGGADEGEDENGNGNRHEACKHDQMNMKRGSAQEIPNEMAREGGKSIATANQNGNENVVQKKS